MRRRSAQYWLWVDNRLPLQTFEDLLHDGRQVEVQARLTVEGFTQVFIGAYAADGLIINEEFHDLEYESCCDALKWGVKRAHAIVVGHQAFLAPHRVQVALNTVITDAFVLALRRMEMSKRERLKLKAEDAWNEYLEAKTSMLQLMRQPQVDAQAWDDLKTRLEQAIDRRAYIQRAYLL
ncbi:hypothetical protein [Pseudomonas sp. NA-150]|uniref:hypothetical protein n=1 Tax=Pseudomonas sp. NA-150 TaxID=3367525 RepID=UPI0037CB10C3